MVIQVNFRFLTQFLSSPLFFTKNKKLLCKRLYFVKPLAKVQTKDYSKSVQEIKYI